jgi:hypothetical protein
MGWRTTSTYIHSFGLFRWNVAEPSPESTVEVIFSSSMIGIASTSEIRWITGHCSRCSSYYAALSRKRLNSSKDKLK